MINPADARVRDTGIPPLTQFSYKMGLINTVALEIPKFSTISLQPGLITTQTFFIQI